MVTKPEFLVAKEKMLVVSATILVAILSLAKAAFIMYTAGGGEQRIFRSPPYHTEFFYNPPLDQKEKHFKTFQC